MSTPSPATVELANDIASYFNVDDIDDAVALPAHSDIDDEACMQLFFQRRGNGPVIEILVAVSGVYLIKNPAVIRRNTVRPLGSMRPHMIAELVSGISG